MEIKILNTFEEFTSRVSGMKYGLYEVATDGARVGIVSRNHNTFRLLSHSTNNKDNLLIVTKEFSDGLLEILGVSGESEE
jgi:cystathionine beta-lyase family protein involved in aluminum resistance